MLRHELGIKDANLLSSNSGRIFVQKNSIRKALTSHAKGLPCQTRHTCAKPVTTWNVLGGKLQRAGPKRPPPPPPCADRAAAKHGCHESATVE
eukprot:857348-Amphidinium_carterae.3